MTTVIRGMKTEAEKALILSKTEEEEGKMSEQKTQTERSFEEARVKLEQMIDQLRKEETKGQSHSQLEEYIWSNGMELLRRLLQGYLDTREEEEIEVA